MSRQSTFMEISYIFSVQKCQMLPVGNFWHNLFEEWKPHTFLSMYTKCVYFPLCTLQVRRLLLTSLCSSHCMYSRVFTYKNIYLCKIITILLICWTTFLYMECAIYHFVWYFASVNMKLSIFRKIIPLEISTGVISVLFQMI